MFYLLSFFFGASIGSFVQVVVTRLHVAPIMASRSKCLSCGEALRAYDLIPFLSYLLLRGKCRYCKTSYGISSLLVEGGYGLLFVLLYQYVLVGQVTTALSLLWLAYYTLLFIVLGVIALYDSKHTYVPFSFLLSYSMLALLMLAIRYTHEPSPVVLLAPFLVAAPFLVLYLVSRGRALGFGDVIMFLGVGAFFGVAQGLAVLLVSVWIGALTGIGMYLFKKKSATLRTELPFVPFIVIAFLLILFTDIDVFSIASLFA